MRDIMPKSTRIAVSVVTVMVGVVLAVVLFAAASSGPGHADLWEKQSQIEDRLRFIACLLLFEPEDRTPETVVMCQAVPTETTTTTTNG